MSNSIHVQAIIPVDGEMYRRHAAVLSACEAAGVSIPPETASFFDDNEDEREVTKDGIRVHIDRYSRFKAATGDVMGDGETIVDLSKLPPGTTKLRVYVSG